MTEPQSGASRVSVVVLNYNGRAMLPDCFDSIRRLERPPLEILLVDDGSTDGSIEWVREHHPDVRICSMGANTRRLNKVRNRGLREARGELVLLVDNDVTLRADCVERLVEHLDRLPDAAVCIPRTLYLHDPQTIYQDGQVLHFVGATRAIHRNRPAAGTDESPRISIGWGVQLIDRAKADGVDGFNERYVMGWGDDGEFNHRLNLAGQFCYQVPAAICYHRRVEAARRYETSVRNRWRFVLGCYEARTLVLCAPAFVLYELALVVFLASQGALGAWLRGTRGALGDLGSIRDDRRRIQPRRKLRDGQLMGAGPIFVPAEYMNRRWFSAALAVLHGTLDLYWKLVRRPLGGGERR